MHAKDIQEVQKGVLVKGQFQIRRHNVTEHSFGLLAIAEGMQQQGTHVVSPNPNPTGFVRLQANAIKTRGLGELIEANQAVDLEKAGELRKVRIARRDKRQGTFRQK